MTRKLLTSTALPVGWLLLAVGALPTCRRAPSAESSGKASVTLMGLALQAGEELRRDVLDGFTRTTGVHVDLIPTLGSSAEQFSQIRRLLERHADTPDVYLIDVIWPGALEQHLLDLTPYLDEDGRGHLPELIRNDTVNGRIVSLPFYMNIGMLYYRRDLLEKYGYRYPPGTWSELEAMAANIQERERASGKPKFWGYIWQGAAYEGLTCNALEWQTSFGGGHVIEPDGTITINNPRSIRAFRKAARWVGSISPGGVLNYTEADSLNVFRSGNAAFMRYWNRGYALNDKTGLALLPAGSHGRAQTIGGFHFAVSRYSRHPRQAAQLVLYLTGRKVQLQRALRGGYLPTISCLFQEKELLRKLPQIDLLKSTGSNTWIARPSAITGSKYAEVSRAYYQAVHSILRGAATAEDAMAGLERRLTDLTGLHAAARCR